MIFTSILFFTNILQISTSFYKPRLQKFVKNIFNKF